MHSSSSEEDIETGKEMVFEKRHATWFDVGGNIGLETHPLDSSQ